MRPEDLVLGQFRGYRDEAHVARDSQVPTCAALRLFVDSWRWQRAPFDHLQQLGLGVVVLLLCQARERRTLLAMNACPRCGKRIEDEGALVCRYCREVEAPARCIRCGAVLPIEEARNRGIFDDIGRVIGPWLCEVCRRE